MERTLVRLPDGTEIFSGADTQWAVQSALITSQVNEGTELAPGAACAAMAQLRFIAPGGSLPVEAGAELTVYRVAEDGTRRQLGIFLAEQPTRPSPNILALTAYDKMVCLDRDVSAWLQGLQAWPYTLRELAAMVCSHCGVALRAGDLPNGGFPVRAFSGDGITGRQIIKWIGQLTGRFARVDGSGALEFAWYASGPAAPQTFGLSYTEYDAAAIGGVWLRGSQTDVGAAYPQGAENALVITGNPLCAGAAADQLETLAQTLFAAVSGLDYTPGAVTVPADTAVMPGDIITLTAPGGRVLTLPVMKKTLQGQRAVLEATGSRSRDSTAAVNNQSYKALSGKLMELRTDIDGLRAENRDAGGQMASLALTVDGVATQVAREQVQTQGLMQSVTALEQTASELALTVRTMRQEGAGQVTTAMGYTFDDTGLRIGRSGQQMENLLDNTGMYVRRSGQTVLRANAQGVTAADVTVDNYLVIGSHARLEDYAPGRTACFYV